MARGTLLKVAALLMVALVAGATSSAPAHTAEDAAQLAAIQAMTTPGDGPKNIRIRAAADALATAQSAFKDRFWDCACTKDSAAKNAAGASPWSCSCALAGDGAAPVAGSAPNNAAPKPAEPAKEAPKDAAKHAPAPKVEAPKVDAPKVDAPKPTEAKPAPQQQQQQQEQPKADAPKPAADVPKAEAPKPKAPEPKEAPKVVKAVVVIGPKADDKKEAQKPAVAPKPQETPKQEAPKQEAPIAQQPVLTTPQPVAQQPAPVQQPVQQVVQQPTVPQPAQQVQPQQPLPAPVSDDRRNNIRRNQAPTFRGGSMPGSGNSWGPQPARGPFNAPGAQLSSRPMPSQAQQMPSFGRPGPQPSSGFGMPNAQPNPAFSRPGGAGLGVPPGGRPAGSGNMGIPGGMGGMPGTGSPRDTIMRPPRDMQMPSGPNSFNRPSMSLGGNMGLFGRQMPGGMRPNEPEMPMESQGPVEPRTLGAVLRPMPGGRRPEERREPQVEYVDARERPLREEREEEYSREMMMRERPSEEEMPREMAGRVREEQEERWMPREEMREIPREMAGEVPRDRFPREEMPRERFPREDMPREMPREMARDEPEEWVNLAPREEPRPPMRREQPRMSIREEPEAPLREEPPRMPLREEPSEPIPQPPLREEPREPVNPKPAPAPKEDDSIFKNPNLVATPAPTSIIADEDSVTIVAELKMTAGFQGDCGAHAVDWVQERASRLLVADLDYKGIKSKVKSAKWTCDQSSGRVMMKFVMQIEPVCDYRAFLRKFSCTPRSLVPELAAALAEYRNTDLCVFKLGEPDRGCTKMDTFAYTVSQPELPPISELGNWAELSIAKNRDWDKTNFKPWYADFLPYNPKDPYGMKRLGEEKKSETVEKPAEQPAAGKDSSKTARSKPHSNLVTSNMRRLLAFFGY